MTAISANSVRKKADRSKKRGFYFFLIVDGGVLTPNPPTVRTPLILEMISGINHFTPSKRVPICFTVYWLINDDPFPIIVVGRNIVLNYCTNVTRARSLVQVQQ